MNPTTMPVTIWTFTEDTDANGTTSQVFKTEADLKDHLQNIIISSMDEHDIELRDDGYHFKDEEPESQYDIDALEYLRDGNVFEAFTEWQEGNYRKDLDTYNWDEVTVEIPLPASVQALVDAAFRVIGSYEHGVVGEDAYGALMRAAGPFAPPCPQPVEPE